MAERAKGKSDDLEIFGEIGGISTVVVHLFLEVNEVSEDPAEWRGQAFKS